MSRLVALDVPADIPAKRFMSVDRDPSHHRG
jgi:hypothetical protein